jgi:hypothetical protein
MKILKNRIGVRLLVSVLCVFSAHRGASAADSATERRYQAVIKDVNFARRSLRVVHKPTGYETEVYWDERTKLSASGIRDFDDLSEGWGIFWVEKADSAAKTIENVARIQAVDIANPPVAADEPAPKSMFKAKLVREKNTSTGKAPDTVLTRDGTFAYFMDVNGSRWRIIPGRKRSRIEYVQSFSPDQFKIGAGFRELVYLEESGRSRIVSAVVQLSGEKQHGDVGRATGTTAERIFSEAERLRAAYAGMKQELHKIAPVKMFVDPEISLPGEPVAVRMEVWAARRPGSDLIFNQHYLQLEKQSVSTLTLDWKANENVDGLTRYTATVNLPALSVGQYNVQWNCDVGGEIKEFWRSFAVAEKDTLVVMLHFTTGRVNREFDEFRLPYDYWEEGILRLFGGPLGERKTPAKAEEWLTASKEYRRRGAAPNMHIIGGNYAGRSGWPPPVPVQFCAEPPDVQLAVLRMVSEFSPMLGFRTEDIGCTGYEFGTETVNLAREAGIRLIGSLCVHQNWQDNAWGINHTARPLRPYFSAQDDFRKAGPGGSNGMVMVSQLDKSILWTEYGVGVFEPAWLERDWPGGGAGGRRIYDEIFMSRHFDLLNAALQNTINQQVPYFQSIGIEFSKADPEEMTTKANALMIRYAVDLARQGKVVFCNQTAAADFYRRYYTNTPETVFYDADFWCGTKAAESISSSWKPVDYPDLIQIENSRYSAYFKRPAALPEYHWNYTVPWNYPVWGNEALPRSPVGVLVPGEHDKFAVTPKITDTRGVNVSRQLNEKAEGLEVVISVDSLNEIKALPIALWDLPRDWKAGNDWWTVDAGRRFVPIRAPYTGNLNGILEVDVRPGKNEYRLMITTPQRDPVSQDIFFPAIHGKVFERDGQSMAYLWPTRPWDITFEIDVPAGRQAQCYTAPAGERVELKPGIQHLVIPKEKWVRIVGLSREELLNALKGSCSAAQE